MEEAVGRVLDLYEELRHLLRRLTDAGAQFALCGGLAVAVHGKVRATIDIDLLVPQETLEQVKKTCIAAGFAKEARAMDLGHGAIRVVRLTKVEPATGDFLSVDLIVVSDAILPAWKTREIVTWEGERLPVVSRQGLISMKRLRGSRQDLADIEALETGNGD